MADHMNHTAKPRARETKLMTRVRQASGVAVSAAGSVGAMPVLGVLMKGEGVGV